MIAHIQICFSIAQVYGDKDPDGFYWGELRGRRGYVPHNMVTEIEDNQVGAQGPMMGGGGSLPGTNSNNRPTVGQAGAAAAAASASGQPLQQSVRGVSRDRWGDIYANMPVKRMIALYDYDPQELSPNVDAEVSPYKLPACVCKCVYSVSLYTNTIN